MRIPKIAKQIATSYSRKFQIRDMELYITRPTSIGDKGMDLEFWGGKEKVDGICSVGCQE